MLQSQHLLSSNFPFLPFPPTNPYLSPHSLPSRFNFFCRPLTVSSASIRPRARLETWLAEAPDESTATAPDNGPIELPPSTPSIFASTDSASPLQVATSVLLTGAISVFLFRSLRRRAKRAKELQFRSSGSKKSMKEEAIENLKTMAPSSVEAKKGTPSPVEALLGGISAGVIALILYKFTTTIGGALNRQPLSDNYSVRQITITIRTIVNGLCYLATFVFGANSLGLLLYSGQLAINSFNGEPSSKGIENKGEAQLTSNLTSTSSTDSSETGSKDKEQSSDSTQ